MKVIALIASYRKKGNTTRVVEMVLESLRQQSAGRDQPVEIETVFLGHQNIQLCRGCRLCFDKGEALCPLKDDLLPIKAKLQAADVVIAASPVYVDDVSGTMKNWIDRMAHLCHRPGFAGKSVYLIATTGTTPTGRTLETLTNAFTLWGYQVIGKAGFISGALLSKEVLESRCRARAEKIAGQILRSLDRQSALRPSFRSLLTFKVQQTAWQKYKTPSYDLDYWRGAGWTEPGCDFYIPHHASRMKVAMARLAGSLIAPFFVHAESK